MPADLTLPALIAFVAATFAAAVITGIAGFAFGLIAAGVWLFILTPLQTATLIIALGLVVQGVSVWKLRRALRWTANGNSCCSASHDRDHTRPSDWQGGASKAC